jgi:hypothetical protein
MIIGKRVLELWVNEGEAQLYLVTDDGVFETVTYADCCSETWFADITGVAALLGGVVAKADVLAEQLGTDVEDGRTRQEYDEVYGYQITTNQGRCDIVFRNSSNGYYGGSFEGWTAVSGVPESARRITDDWSA